MIMYDPRKSLQSFVVSKTDHILIKIYPFLLNIYPCYNKILIKIITRRGRFWVKEGNFFQNMISRISSNNWNALHELYIQKYQQLIWWRFYLIWYSSQMSFRLFLILFVLILRSFIMLYIKLMFFMLLQFSICFSCWNLCK